MFSLNSSIHSSLLFSLVFSFLFHFNVSFLLDCLVIFPCICRAPSLFHFILLCSIACCVSIYIVCSRSASRSHVLHCYRTFFIHYNLHVSVLFLFRVHVLFFYTMIFMFMCPFLRFLFLGISSCSHSLYHSFSLACILFISPTLHLFVFVHALVRRGTENHGYYLRVALHR